MKWLVKTLDSLLPYASEQEAAAEQQNLEALIGRYKNLIPTIEITMTKTEVFSKCYTYRREVHEVVCLLSKVKDQTVSTPAPDSLDRLNKMIKDQEFAINQLDHQRSHIMSMLQRGRDLSKDVHAPAFVQTEVKNLETGWNDAYGETVDKLRNLKTTQVVWDEFQTQKDKIGDLLGSAETELRSITPLQTHPQNVLSDLKNKRELNYALHQASRVMIGKLHELCDELTPQADQAKKPLIEKEVTELEKQFFNTMEHVKDRVNYLEDYSNKWNTYKAKVGELQNWSLQAAPQLIESVQSQELSPEERVVKAEALQAVISEKMRALDVLHSEASELAPKEGNVTEAKRLKGDVYKLQEMLSVINRNASHQAITAKEDLLNWQKYQAGIQEIKPWIEKSESKVSVITEKPQTLQQAIQLQQQAKQFESQCQQQHDKLQNVATISNQMTCKTNAPDELDAVQSRWSSVHENTKQVINKYDRLVAGWQSFDSDANKLEEWIDNSEKAISKRPNVLNTPHVDKLEKELAKLKSFNNEISEQQAKVVTLTQGSEQLALNLAPEGVAVVKERVNAMRAKIVKLSEICRAKINDVSDAIMSRQDFNAQLANFSNWADQLRSQSAQVEELYTERVEPGLQIVHSLLQEHSDKKPAFNAIYEEVKNLTLSSTPEEQQAINDSYTTLVSNYQNIEDDLQQKKASLEKWAEFLGWKNETESHANHIKQQLDKGDKLGPAMLDNIIEEITTIIETITHWKNEATVIDRSPAVHLKDSNTGRPLNASQVVNELENKLENLKLKTQNRIAELSKIDERKKRFVEIENKLANNLSSNQSTLEQIINVTPNPSNIDQIILDLSTLHSSLQNNVPLKAQVHDEGTQLMREDITSMPAVQESILILDKNWDNLETEVAKRLEKYTIINQNLKDYETVKSKLDNELEKAQKIYVTVEKEPVGEKQLLETAEKSKKALDQVKKSKAVLDEVDRKGNELLKLFQSVDSVIPNDIAQQLDSSHHIFKTLQSEVARNAQLYETEAIIWNQIEELKAEVIPWLDDTIQSLTDAADNTLEIEYGPMRLTKYRAELPSYTGIKEDILEKVTELTKINQGAKIPYLDELENALEQKFITVEQCAQNLEEVATSFEEQEKDLRQAVKKCGENINKLRENLIKCDDMTGDNNQIVERLQNCQALRAQLQGEEGKLDNLSARIDEMKFTYPTFADTIVPKELSNVQKRLDVVTTHANKIEQSLLQFIKKFHVDKIGMLKRLVSAQKEKINWCVPEPSSDKYNLEVKTSSMNDVQKGILDCISRQQEIAESIALLDQIDSPENVATVRSEIAQISDNLNQVQQTFDNAKVVLDENVSLWHDYDDQAEAVTTWLKEIETKIKTEAASQIELPNIENKAQELSTYDQDIKEHKPLFDVLDKTAKAIMNKNSESRVGQVAKHLNARHQAVAKNIGTLLDRVTSTKETFDTYNQNKEDCKDWLQNARIQFNELARMGSPGSGPTRQQLELVKTFVSELGTGQAHVNAVSDSAETLYPVVTPDNRENIRNEVKHLREDFDNIHDEANSLLSQVESILIQKTTIEESYSQVQNWLSESKKKMGEQPELYPTLAEKKSALHRFRAQLQDNNLHKNALKQLLDKAQSLGDIEAEDKVKDSLKNLELLNRNIEQRIAILENQVVNHEAYDQILEKAQDWLKTIKTEALDVLNDTTIEKQGAEEKLAVIDNIISHRPQGDKIFNACQKQLETVLVQTHPSGHPALINGLEGKKAEWQSFINQCETLNDKLKRLHVQWNEVDSVIDTLDTWLKKIENVVKDQNLKSTWETKQAHLDKLKVVNDEINAKQPEIAKILDKCQEIEGESDTDQRVSRLNTRYQTLKNLCKESINRYETYSKDHKTFNDEYNQFRSHLHDANNNLIANSEVVGDLDELQARQNVIRDISERRINDASTFENIIDRGEKLYVHTSPEGREIIRQQLRALRADWDQFSDNLNIASQKIEQCLLQFGDFTAGQEQLSKWLKDVEKAMQSHTELKTSLQEKRAQLQNHKLMHQDILGHGFLVDTVCDKAQVLVDQTQDESLNTYLHSIKQLFTKIVEKSQNLLGNLEDCVQAHQNYNGQAASLKSWLSGEKQKLLECEDIAGEKGDLNRKLNILEQLGKNKDFGQKLLKDLIEQAEIVKRCTSDAGIQIIDKEVGDLAREFANHFIELDASKEKQNALLQQWVDFENNYDELTKWCREKEALFREQPLESTLEDKERQLNVLKAQREQVLQKQKDIDQCTDQAHNLLTNSGVERLKTLASQLANRYQTLQVLSKDVANRWQNAVEDHRKYSDKLAEVNTWLTPIEKQLYVATHEEPADGSASKILQALINEQDRAEPLLASVNSLGEKALPETSTQGREKIRQDLRDIRDRWDRVNEGIRGLQKRQEAQSLQWSSYQDNLQQILTWLDSTEKLLEQENPNSWTSTQEIRSKILKYKTTLQDVIAHKRNIEAVNDKANALVQNNVPSNADEILNTVNSINARYENVSQNCNKLIAQLEEAVDAYQQFNDLQKAQQDYQKSLWDRLSGYSDYSGSKPALQGRLQKINEIQDALNEGRNNLQQLTNHVDTKSNAVPSRSKEVMARDLTNMKVDFDKFTATLQDVKTGLENKLQQWNDYETNLDRLVALLVEAENSLKNYAPKNTLEEKQEQLNKFQVRIILFEYLYEFCFIE